MSAPAVAFFNNKGGVGKTSLVYHIAWMIARKGLRIVAVDLDPQANLTANFLAEEQLEELWPGGNVLTAPGRTISPRCSIPPAPRARPRPFRSAIAT